MCLDTVYFVENWKYCSKIIFKFVNSTVGPIFNEKVVKKKRFMSLVNSAQDPLVWHKAIETQFKKKKKKKKGNVDANAGSFICIQTDT